MTAYIIAYTIVMLAVCAACVALCLLWVRNYRKKLNKDFSSKSIGNAGADVFANVYGSGDIAFLLVDADTHQAVYVSPNISSFFGVTVEDVFLDIDSLKTALKKNDRRAFERDIAKWKGDADYKQEFKYGDGKCAEAQAFKTYFDGKNYIAFMFSDITERSQQIADMQVKLDDALMQAASKSTFLSNMSHEIRTPMNGIMGMMSLARMNIDDKEKVMSYLERAGDLTVFLLGMINDILDISKIESGKMILFNTDLDIFAFAEKIRNMFTGTVTGKGIDFLVETVDFTVRYLSADELRLTQVVTNLVSNANKFTPAGGKITVTFKQLDLFGDNIQLMIRVRDTGKGIAPENIKKIMHPFEQEEASTAHNYGGTGLGLAICDNIVRMMGGNIVIDSVLGKGSDFSIFLSLPVVNVEQDLSAPIEFKTTAVKNDFSFDGCRILLAEDNEINAEIAIEILESEGAVVTWAHDGQEAVDIYNDKPEGSFDLLLMDIQMPRLDGRSAAKIIRASGKSDAKSVPIVALSAEAFVEEVKLSEEAGMDRHVSKPIDFNELRKQVGEVIIAKKEES